MSEINQADFSFSSPHQKRHNSFNRESEFSIHRKKWLSSNDLCLVILNLLQERSRHGYEIIRSVEAHTCGFYAPSPGMIYPVLSKLERNRFAVSKLQGTKKLFELTDKGRDVLRANMGVSVAIMEQIKTYGEKMAYFQNQLLQEERTNERWGGGFGRDNLDLKVEFMKTRRDLKAAIFEKVASSIEEKKRVIEVMKKAVADIRKTTP